MTNEIDQIESAAKAHAENRNELADRVQALKEEQEAAKRKRLRGIKTSVGRFRESYQDLMTLLSTSRTLFTKPKSKVFHGLRVGFKKRPGKLIIRQPAKTVSLIKKHLPDQAETLIQVKETPVKTALNNLPASDLKKIGVEIESDTDEHFCKPIDGDVEKLLDGLVGDDLDEEAA